MVALSEPAICGSETLTTVVSSTSMNVANITAMATIHGLIWRGSPDMEWVGLFCEHRGCDRKTRPELVFRISTALEHQFHGNALHHFHEIAGGIFGRQQTESC